MFVESIQLRLCVMSAVSVYWLRACTVCVCVVVDDGYQTLSSDCLRKRAAVRQLKLQIQQLEVQTAASHQSIDTHVQQLVVSFLFILSYSVLFTVAGNCI